MATGMRPPSLTTHDGCGMYLVASFKVPCHQITPLVTPNTYAPLTMATQTRPPSVAVHDMLGTLVPTLLRMFQHQNSPPMTSDRHFHAHHTLTPLHSTLPTGTCPLESTLQDVCETPDMYARTQHWFTLSSYTMPTMMYPPAGVHATFETPQHLQPATQYFPHTPLATPLDVDGDYTENHVCTAFEMQPPHAQYFPLTPTAIARGNILHSSPIFYQAYQDDVPYNELVLPTSSPLLSLTSSSQSSMCECQKFLPSTHVNSIVAVCSLTKPFEMKSGYLSLFDPVCVCPLMYSWTFAA